MELIKAMQSEDAFTENGALTHSTTSDRVVDLFFQINAMRSRSEQDIINLFVPAVEESPLDAMKILFYSRDIRGGQGERRTFRILLKYLAETRPELVLANLDLVPVYGRWDDLFVLENTELEKPAFDLIKKALLEDHNPLLAKWLPREKSSKKQLAIKLINHLGISPKRYRKILSEFTKVVEQAMCANDWNSINYQHVPSYAMKNYRKAFNKHSPEKWAKYIKSLKTGEAKVNASTLYPHDLVKPLLYGAQNQEVLNEQWKALPNYMKNNSDKIIPVCDVSGSMSGIPMEVSIALGLYISERNEGIFKNAFITFSTKPKMEVITGNSLRERVLQLRKADWGMSTDLAAVFRLILENATKHQVSPVNMPTMLLILSDMEFDECTTGMTMMNEIHRQYMESGYRLPKIVFWNLRAAQSNFPVKYNEEGVALVSGFSPSILTQLLDGNDNFNPAGIMRKTIDNERYDAVKIHA